MGVNIYLPCLLYKYNYNYMNNLGLGNVGIIKSGAETMNA